MTTSVFSTVDRLTSRVKPLDRLITTVAARLLPQHEASAYNCGDGFEGVDFQCGPHFCLPTSDIYYSLNVKCCNFLHQCFWLTPGCCDCCLP